MFGANFSFLLPRPFLLIHCGFSSSVVNAINTYTDAYHTWLSLSLSLSLPCSSGARGFKRRLAMAL